MQTNHSELTARGVSAIIQGLETAREVLDAEISRYRDLLRAAQNGELEPKRRGRPPKDSLIDARKAIHTVKPRSKPPKKKNTGGWGGLTKEQRAARVRVLQEANARSRAAKLAQAETKVVE